MLTDTIGVVGRCGFVSPACAGLGTGDAMLLRLCYAVVAEASLLLRLACESAYRPASRLWGSWGLVSTGDGNMENQHV